jgi:hypothetical protein
MRDYPQPADYPEQNCLKSSAAEERDQLDSNPHPPGIANSHPRQPSCLSAGQINLHVHLVPETNLITEPGNGGHTKNTLVFSFPKKKHKPLINKQ